MTGKLSVLMITKNSEETIESSLRSVVNWVDEIVIIDDYSKDKTVEIVRKVLKVHKVYKVVKNQEEDLGIQRAFGLKKCTNDLILVLDSDEVVTKELQREIVRLLHGNIDQFDGYLIPFQTHLFGRKLRYGGENYQKLVLFKKGKATIDPQLIGEKFTVTSGKVGVLKNKILHYSYRSLGQMYRKFTDYAIRDAKDRIKHGEITSLKKIFLYPPHMFWARFIKDQGYKDGWYRLPLDIGFAYMEWLTYLNMLFIKNVNQLKS